jgi:RimJ/RimL family protein N-acetyltransferase
MTAERLRASHFDDLHRMHREPAVMATLASAGKPLSRKESRRTLQSNLQHWDRYGYGLWIFRDKASGEFIGRGGLLVRYVEGEEMAALAYAVMPEYWGRGLATEMAEALLEVGFKQLGLAEMACYALPTNRASLRVMEKAGFRYEREITYAGLPHLLYRLTASTWENARDRTAPCPQLL